MQNRPWAAGGDDGALRRKAAKNLPRLHPPAPDLSLAGRAKIVYLAHRRDAENAEKNLKPEFRK